MIPALSVISDCVLRGLKSVFFAYAYIDSFSNVQCVTCVSMCVGLLVYVCVCVCVCVYVWCGGGIFVTDDYENVCRCPKTLLALALSFVSMLR